MPLICKGRRRRLLLINSLLCWVLLLKYDSFLPERIRSISLTSKSDLDYDTTTLNDDLNEIMQPITRQRQGSHFDIFETTSDLVEGIPSSNSARLRRRKTPEARIIGGGEATKNRYPYMASITYERAHVCGGSLIADDIILTAAHCWEHFDGVDMGRHNIKDPDEVHERFNIERFATHDDFVDKNMPGVPYDNDFMILKLYGWSMNKPIRLTQNNHIPSNTELSVMGWGVSDLQNQISSEVLKEVTVNSLSNYQCKQYSGFYGPNVVSYSNKITPNMLCAKDYNEDACQGDSGGPLIIRGLLARNDVQVGIVSWGLGCAHESFPGVYSRISSQFDWIKEHVCLFSEAPPDEFGCEKADRKDNENKGNKRAVTVEIMLDRFPKETGWLIRNEGGTSVAYIPIGGYKSVQESEKHIFATVHLHVDHNYEFIMLDSYGDGLKFDGGQYKLWLGDTPYMGQLLLQGSTFERAIHHPFYVPVMPPTPSPVINNTPTNTPPPPSPTTNGQPTVVINPPQSPPVNGSTLSPSLLLVPYITLAIKFDNQPEEIGWSVTSSMNEMISFKSIGSYTEKNKLVIERVQIPEQYSNDGIMFALLDNGKNGLCCNFGQGFFQIFLGDLSDDIVIAKGSKFSRLQHIDIDLNKIPSTTVNGKSNTPTPFKQELHKEPSTVQDSEPTKSRGTVASLSSAIEIVFLIAIWFAM